MSSFLFTTIAAVVGVVVLAPSYATNIPTTNPGCTTGVLGADNIANGSASLEPDFSANTINTTWYSNGTQLTGNNIPGTCRYDAPLVPPTPSPRAGYAFNGWTLRVPAVPAGPFDNLDASTSVTSIGYNNFCSNADAEMMTGVSQYQSLTGQSFAIPGQWGIQLSDGSVVRGVAECRSSGDTTYYGNQSSGESYFEPQSCNYSFMDANDTEHYGTVETSDSYCWCKATGYKANGGSLQTDDSTSWVFLEWVEPVELQPSYGITGCGLGCAYRCATVAQNSQSFRAALYGQSQ